MNGINSQNLRKKKIIMKSNLSYLTSSYDYRNDLVHLWEVDSKGEVFYSENEFVPFIFVDAPPSSDSKYSNLNNRKVVKKTFDSYREYKDFVNRYMDTQEKQIYENNFSPRELQYIVDRYKHVPVKDRKSTVPRIHIFDIETDSSTGFVKPEEATSAVLSIAIYDTIDKNYYVYGREKFDLAALIKRLKKNGTYDDAKNLISKMKYVRCMSEQSLLISAFRKMKLAWIYSGWNIENYDIPYLFNRCKILNDSKVTKAFNDISPIGSVRSILNAQAQQKKGVGNSYFRNYIPGKLIIDYMIFYKKFSYTRQSSYALDFVSLNEFGRGKVKLYDDKGIRLSLTKLYEQKFEEFILYNARDCEMIQMLDNKYKIFEFALFISVQCNIPADKVINMSNVVDGALLFYLRQFNQVAPGIVYNHSTFYPGGYVKDSQKGLYDWVVDFDITSSYPSHQICLNISPETLLGQLMTKNDKILLDDSLKIRKTIQHLKPDDTLELLTETQKKSLLVRDFKKLLKNKAISIAGDGRIYDQTFEGLMPRFLKESFEWRMVLKKQMIKADNDMLETNDEDKIKILKTLKKKFYSQQLFAKMILNSVYGQTANRFSRYYSIGCATSITTSGVKSIKISDKILNAFFKEDYAISEPWFGMLWENLSKYKLWTDKEFKEKLLEVKEKTKNQDYVLFVDTDSDGYYLGPVIKILADDKLDTKTTIEFLLDICKVIQIYLNQRIKKEIKEFYYNSSKTDFEINFKQEIVAQKALILGKKKYGLWVVNKDGVPQNKVSITGIEIIKSDTPKIIRKSLKEIIDLILKGKDQEKTKNELKLKIDQTKKEILGTPNDYTDLMDYATSFNLNKFDSYVAKRNNPFEIPKSCPIHVRSAIHYNDLLKKLNLEKNYPILQEGTKVFFIPVIPKTNFLKKYNVTSLAFIENTLPIEFFEYVQVNFKQIVQKNFTDKAKILLNPTKFLCCLSDEFFLIQKLFH